MLLGPYTQETSGEGLGGIAWLDYDQDGNLDLYLTNGPSAPNGLFRNNGDGTFTNVSAETGVANGLGNSGVVIGDIDNDGYPDIFLTGEGRLAGPVQTPTRMYHNNGDLTFTDITASAGVSGLYVDAFGDIVSDGACVASFSDYNNDGLADIFVGNCNAFFSPNIDPTPFVVRPAPLNLYRNNGDGTFTDVADAAGINLPGLWMGLAFGDYDNDGDIDLFATSLGTAAQSNYPHALFRNNGDGTYSEVSTEVGIPNSEFSWGVTFADFDNNGGLDLYQAGALPLFGVIGPGQGSPGRLYFNNGTGHFTEDTSATGIDLSSKYSSGLAQADFDGDGFTDIAIMTAPYSLDNVTVSSEDFVLLRNQGNHNHWLTVRLVGTDSNRDGIGARIQVKTGKKHQLHEVRAGSSFASSETPWPTFGLGKYHQAKITVTWPSGLTEIFPKNKANKLITLVEGTGKKHRKEKHKREKR
jgi:enediyne biosynthesis protein E4